MHKALTYFSEQAREALRGRVFNVHAEESPYPNCAVWVCTDGMCVAGVLLNVEYPGELERLVEDGQVDDDEGLTPTPDAAMQVLANHRTMTEDEAFDAKEAIADLISRNDMGLLTTSEQVAALLEEG